MIDYMDSAEKLKCITQRVNEVNEKPSKQWLLIATVITLLGAYLLIDDCGGFKNGQHNVHVLRSATEEVKNA